MVTLYQAEAVEDLKSMGEGKTTRAQERMAEAFGAKTERAQRARGGTKGRKLERKRSKRW